MKWTDADRQRLAALSRGGHSYSKIGVMMNRSKNSVIGKAHMMKLPARPSPINLCVDGAKLPRKPKPLPLPRAAVMLTPLLLEIAAPIPAPAIHPRSMVLLSDDPCSWITGDPATTRGSVKYCDTPCVRGKSYCPEHHAISVPPMSKAPSSIQRAGKSP